MKHYKRLPALIFGLFVVLSVSAHAEQKATFQLSFVPPLQLHPAQENLEGFGLGFVNEADGHVHGAQVGLVNIDKREMTGFQVGILYNNVEEDTYGIQLGIVNHTGSLKGIQIGILNFDDDEKYLGFFPFLNASF